MIDYGINSHKLILHPQEVAKWDRGEEVFPINAEIALSGACNHRCIFCSVDYMGYEPSFLKTDLLLERIGEMQSLGLKSVLLAGNGEPLIHKDATKIINGIKKRKVDVALSTNGVLFNQDIASECMESLSWVRFSTSAGTSKTYQEIHRGGDCDFDILLNNIASAVKIKKENGYHTVLGIQIVMIPENANEILGLAKIAKELGVDWFSVKTVGWLADTKSELKNSINREEFYESNNHLFSELNEMSTDSFSVICRQDRVNLLKSDRRYHTCLAAPFHIAIDSNGDVEPCCNFLGVNKMKYGNINNNTFIDIWHSNQRKEVLRNIAKSNLSECPMDCKLAKMNEYLYELKHPGEHVNFI